VDAFFATFLSALALAAPPPEPASEPFGLEWPASGQVTDGFGPRWGRLHTGIDIGILSNLGVVAAANGKVKATGYLPGYEGYGLVVLLGHGKGRETLYAHLSRIGVREGEWLTAGEPIGHAGCTGSCTGTHLHFELREGGRPIDPSPFLR
jgi:murein DD-endopeptidase MepM/ murein hydrolase activator NlpD